MAKQREQRTPTPGRYQGLPVVFVPLANSEQCAIVEPEVLERLTALGVSTQWTLNAAKPGGYLYVRACADRRSPIAAGRSLLSVAPLIMAAGRDQQVSYRDGNRLNLLRSNLVIEPRRGRRRALGEQPIYVPRNDRTGEHAGQPGAHGAAAGASE